MVWRVFLVISESPSPSPSLVSTVLLLNSFLLLSMCAKIRHLYESMTSLIHILRQSVLLCNELIVLVLYFYYYNFYWYYIFLICLFGLLFLIFVLLFLCFIYILCWLYKRDFYNNNNNNNNNNKALAVLYVKN